MQLMATNRQAADRSPFYWRNVMNNNEAHVAPLLLSIKEAAITLGVCERTIWTLAQERQLPHVRVGRRVLFSRAALEAWITRQETAS
jgi:excisionase family DNA binding protein